MVKTQADLKAEVSELILSGIEAGQVMPAGWITEAIMEKHPIPVKVLGDHHDFYTLCGFAHVRDTVRQCLRAYKDDTSQEIPEQLKLPGYDDLQKAYLIERDEEQMIVPITQCTEEELNAKIAEYRRMAEGCLHHADELVRYRKEKFGH
jgi:hypothetical protein